MNEQQVNELLELADAGAATPGLADAGLADRAIRLARRRTRTRRVGLGVLAVDAVAALALVVFWMIPGTSKDKRLLAVDTQPSDTPVVVDSTETEALMTRIAMQEEVVRLLLVTDNNPAQATQAPDPLDAIQRHIDRAARQMVLTADRIEHDAGPSDFTRGLYKDVVANFPDTDWARLARQRIDEQDYLTEPRSAL